MNSTRAEKFVGIGEILWDQGPKTRTLGGAPANFAFHAAQLGVDASVVSRVGDDADGTAIREAVEKLGLSSRYLQTDPVHPTGKVDVMLDDGKATYHIHTPSAWDYLEYGNDLINLASNADVVCFGMLARRLPVSARTIESFLDSTRKDCVRIFDVNLRPPFVDRTVLESGFSRATLVKLNDEELAQLIGMFECGDERAFFRYLFEGCGVGLIAITLGPEGSRLVSPQAEWNAPGVKVKVADTVGAGDAFTAALAVGLCRGFARDRLLPACNAVGAYVASQSGATPILPEELVRPFTPV